MFLVHDDQSQSPEWQEHGRTDSQYHVVILLGELFLPDFHPFRIGKLGMIHSQPGSEHPSQPFGDLGGEGNFRKEVEYLLAGFQHFFYQVDIDFSLATGRDSMQQTDILGLKTSQNFVKGSLLSGAEGMYGDRFGFFVSQSADFVQISLQYLFVYQILENGLGLSGCFQQLLLADFPDVFPLGIPSRQFQVFHQNGLLFGSPCQHIKFYVQVMFVLQSLCQADPYFRAWLVAPLDFFLDADGFFLQQRLDDRQQILHPTGLLQLRGTLFRVGAEQVQDTLFPWRKRFRSHKVRVVFHQRFTFQLHARRQSRFIHIAQRTEIIVGQPFPERELTGQ